MAEASIAMVATNLGWDVYLPFGDGSRADMVLQDTNGEVFQTQVKWGRLDGEVIKVQLATCRSTPNKGYVRNTYSSEEIDLIAVWCQSLSTAYLIPIAEVLGLTILHLRLSGARNNQKAGVRYAATYQFGAVAQLGERRHGMAEVRGSIPLSSTKWSKRPSST